MVPRPARRTRQDGNAGDCARGACWWHSIARYSSSVPHRSPAVVRAYRRVAHHRCVHRPRGRGRGPVWPSARAGSERCSGNPRAVDAGDTKALMQRTVGSRAPSIRRNSIATMRYLTNPEWRSIGFSNRFIDDGGRRHLPGDLCGGQRLQRHSRLLQRAHVAPPARGRHQQVVARARSAKCVGLDPSCRHRSGPAISDPRDRRVCTGP